MRSSSCEPHLHFIHIENSFEYYFGWEWYFLISIPPFFSVCWGYSSLFWLGHTDMQSPCLPLSVPLRVTEGLDVSFNPSTGSALSRHQRLQRMSSARQGRLLCARRWGLRGQVCAGCVSSHCKRGSSSLMFENNIKFDVCAC